MRYNVPLQIWHVDHLCHHSNLAVSSQDLCIDDYLINSQAALKFAMPLAGAHTNFMV